MLELFVIVIGHSSPELAHAKLKDAQLSLVAGDRVVLVITQHNLPEAGLDESRSFLP